MARGWEAKIGADTRDFEQGVKKGIIKPVDDAAKSLDELADAGEDVGRDGARGLDRLEDALKDAQRQSEKTERAVEDIGDTGKRGLGRAREGAQELNQELGQNASEALSSFRGELGDLGQVGQDTLGGLAGTVATMGPAGIVAGAGLGVAAGAVGALTGAFEKAKEAQDEAKQSAYEYGVTVAESGRFADASQRLSEYTGSIEGLQKVQDLAIATGWKQAEVLKALATGEGLPALTEAFGKGADAATLSALRANELKGVLDGTREGFDLATDGARLQADALFELASAVGVATGEVDDLGNKIVTMPDGKEVVINTETRDAYENLDAFEAKAKGLPDPVIRPQVDDSAARRKLRDLYNTINNTTARIKIGGTGSARQILGG